MDFIPPIDLMAVLCDEEGDSPDQPIIANLVNCSVDPSSRGHRFSAEIREVAFELLRTCGRKALEIVRRRIPLPLRETRCRRPPAGYTRPDLTNPDLIMDRVKT
jgi:hypothetical protein